MNVQVYTINAFIDGSNGGNPAGVVFDADKLSNLQKQLIAEKAQFSETAFVSQSNKADYKLDFFTPTRQIAHCGHATIAVFSYLAQKGFIKRDVSSKETIDGVRKIILSNGLAFMEQTAPKYYSVKSSHAKILDSIGIIEDDLITLPKLVNTGNSFVIVGVKDKQILSGLQPNHDMIESVSNDLDLVGYYIFTPETEKYSSDANTRMFAPRYGIIEEAATGMAAGPLACYLHDELNLSKERFVVEQGHFMEPASPSVIDVNLKFEANSIAALMVGGKANIVNRFNVSI